MKKPTTFEEALLLVPTHWPLMPDVDVWRDGDERGVGDSYGRVNYEKIMRFNAGANLPSYETGRRPIPQDVREKSAVRILYNSTATAPSRSSGWLRFLYPEVDSEEGGIVVACYKDVCTEDNYGLRKFSSKEELVKFYKSLPYHLSSIDLYDNVNPIEEWILAGKP